MWPWIVQLFKKYVRKWAHVLGISDAATHAQLTRTKHVKSCVNEEITVFFFEKQCKNAETGRDILECADLYVRYFDERIWCKEVWNRIMGWALPTTETCEHIVQFWRKHSGRKLVDLGAGSGMFCKVLHHLGIPEDKLLAVDLPRPNYGTYHKTFWPILRAENSVVPRRAILFVAWSGGTEPIIRRFLKRGGRYLILLGEVDGCTLSSDLLMGDSKWNVQLVSVRGPASYMEYLSLNSKRSQIPFAAKSRFASIAT